MISFELKDINSSMVKTCLPKTCSLIVMYPKHLHKKFFKVSSSISHIAEIGVVALPVLCWK